MERYDKIIIGAGLYGLYSALECVKRGQRILVLECEKGPFQRATYINQARVHQGYHYPRSISTALKSAGYFERFNADYSFCINYHFDKIYATSSQYSWTNGHQFKEFCKAAGIPCEELHPNQYFKDGMCDGAFKTREYTYDAFLLRDYFLEQLQQYGRCITIEYEVKIQKITKIQDCYEIYASQGKSYRTDYILNATYASTNQILDKVGFEKFKIKYELCEIILCETNNTLKDIGFTVMDGPFFSIMPFGKTGLHSLTSVTFTPHSTSYENLPQFKCQEEYGGECTTLYLGNCNQCVNKPKTAYPYMSALAEKYLLDKYRFKHKDSLFSMKPILMSSEIDDSRPTIIKIHSKNPTFISVLSGKINTVYDLDEVLYGE